MVQKTELLVEELLFLINLVEIKLLEVRVSLIFDIGKQGRITTKVATAHFGKITLRIELRLHIGVLCRLKVWQRYDGLPG